MTVLDEETPDDDRAEALKAMFFAVNKINSTDADRILNYQLFQISKELTSGELLLLKAIAQLNAKYPVLPANSNFVREVSKLLGHNVTALIRKDIRKLLTTSLLASGSALGDAHDPTDPTGAGVTDLGQRFIANLETYSSVIKESSRPSLGFPRSETIIWNDWCFYQTSHLLPSDRTIGASALQLQAF